MSKSTHLALIASVLLGVSALSACSKDASEPAKETVKNVEKTTTPPAKPIEKPEMKPAPKPAPVEMTPEMAGKKVFARCKACHTINEGGRNRVGPNLHGVIGRKAGTAEEFAYSKAMASSGITWSEETLGEYLKSPQTYVPKNKMSFIGLKKQKDRDNVIAYLKANSGAE